MDRPVPPPPVMELRCCLECDRPLAANEDCETTHNGVFCRACFSRLAAQLNALVRRRAENINYPAALLGALAGAALGIAVWWGFSVLTHIQFGLVAVVIGMAVAKGMLAATGGRRSRALTLMGLAVSAGAYFYAYYLVARSFLIETYPQFAGALAVWPHPAVFMEVMVDSLNGFAPIFLAVVLWQTWYATKPKKYEFI